MMAFVIVHALLEHMQIPQQRNVNLANHHAFNAQVLLHIAKDVNSICSLIRVNANNNVQKEHINLGKNVRDVNFHVLIVLINFLVINVLEVIFFI